jgi:cytochrome d ubiquinol oxidase subunit I
MTSLLCAVEPSSLLPARWQMTVSLGSHIVLACFGVAFPVLIWVVHGRGIRQDDHVALDLAKRWSKVAAVLFAVGAVSGTILSFEMGLLWPRFMRTFGGVIGLPFALEGIAFFLEAIFLGIYLYGWGRMPARLHRAMLIPIAASGLLGTFCILAVNGWMNSPSGFRLVDGKVTDVNPLAAMFNDALWLEFLHMFIGTFIVVGFTVAGVYAAGLLRGRDDRHHRLGFNVAFGFAAVAALVQPVSGHLAGLRLANGQPSKLAAIELAPTTERRADLRIGGVLIDGKVRYAISIPVLGSLIARSSPNGVVPGLDRYAPADRPEDGLVTMVHWSFQLMVASGTALALFGAWFWVARRRGRDLLMSRRFLQLAVVAAPMSVGTLELGWITTEVGRQPWIAYGFMKINDAVTPDGGVWITLVGMIIVYAGMGIGALMVLRSMAQRWRAGAPIDLPTPYSRSS